MLLVDVKDTQAFYTQRLYIVPKMVVQTREKFIFTSSDRFSQLETRFHSWLCMDSDDRIDANTCLSNSRFILGNRQFRNTTRKDKACG